MPTAVDRLGLPRLMVDGAQLVEVLPAEEYDEEHLQGAIHLPLKELTADAARVLDRGGPSSCTAGTRSET